MQSGTTASPRSFAALSARLYKPPDDEPRRAVCLKDRLPLRTHKALSSKVVGYLAADQTVEVIERETLPNGTLRARVGKRSEPRGLSVDPLGWVTVSTDQDEDLMRMLTREEHQRTHGAGGSRMGGREEAAAEWA